jgi:Protein of unknown function (DUF4239)
MTFFTTHSLWLSAFILLVPTTLIAMAGPIVIRRYVRLARLRTNNEVAGFKFATVGVLYAVLLAFAVIVVWEKFNGAEHDVAKEAAATANVYRLTRGFERDEGVAIRKAVTDYLTATITKDWPAMAQGKSDPAANEALNTIYSELLKVRSTDNRTMVVMAEMLDQLDLVGQARRSRLVTATGVVPEILWAVLFGGAILTVGFTFFFGTENLRAQSLMTGALSLLIFAGLLTIIVIDRPFAGTVRVEPDALAAVIADFGGK